MKNKLITIFGGSGFLGRYIVKELAQLGYNINIISRTPSQNLYLKTAGNIGQINVSYCNIHDEESVEKIVKGSYAIINAIGILHQKKKNSFEEVHVNFSKRLANIAKKHSVKMFIHISAMGLEGNHSKYAKTKLNAEQIVINTIPNAYIIRPNVMFGTEDNFFNLFAKLTMISPVLPAIGGGKTKFQPVYVIDVAKAITKLIDKETYQPGIYELAGKNIISLKEILNFILRSIGKCRVIVPIPFILSSMIGKLMSLLPTPLFTDDQVESLKTDCIISNRQKTFKDIDITPSQFDHVVPKYLTRFK